MQQFKSIVRKPTGNRIFKYISINFINISRELPVFPPLYLVFRDLSEGLLGSQQVPRGSQTGGPLRLKPHDGRLDGHSLSGPAHHSVALVTGRLTRVDSHVERVVGERTKLLNAVCAVDCNILSLLTTLCEDIMFDSEDITWLVQVNVRNDLF